MDLSGLEGRARNVGARVRIDLRYVRCEDRNVVGNTVKQQTNQSVT